MKNWGEVLAVVFIVIAVFAVAYLLYRAWEWTFGQTGWLWG